MNSGDQGALPGAHEAVLASDASRLVPRTHPWNAGLWNSLGEPHI